MVLVLKKFMVAPFWTAPYLMVCCFARSSADSMGFSRVSTVKKAAKLAVYDAIIIRAKKNHMPASNLMKKSGHAGVYTSRF